MKFGTFALAAAEGAILAHTHRLASGALKKGRRLSARDLAALAEEGYNEVIAARLEAGDVDEDEAAGRLAVACAGEGVQPEAARTGRSNLFAQRRGLLVVDPRRVGEVNVVDAAMTVATLAPFRIVEPHDMVATIKIIPFAVAEEALARGEASGRAPEPLVRVAPFVRRRAGLICTTLPGVRAAQIDRGAQSQRARMAHLGGAIEIERRCPHTERDVQDNLRALVAEGLDVVMILGASAVVDPLDVVPAAISSAGGRVDHVGMPVDPGNLLVLGSLGSTPVLGVPGCARSLKRSGFDAVLERIVAGLPVTPQDIMQMGAGGLLQEISSRPAPRIGAHPRARPRVAGLVLAAGMSRRMGPDNKLLARVDDTPMVARVVDALIESAADPVVVVTGHDAAEVRAALEGRAVRFVHNPDFAQGMSTSVIAGLSVLDGDVDGALVALADMPWIRAAHVDALVAAFDPAGPHTICVPVYDRKRGNPVLWSARHFPEMLRLSGDVGGRHLLEAHGDAVLQVAMPDAAVNLDVDTPQALAELTRAKD